MEVMRTSGDIEERIAGGDDAADASFDKETPENKLTCMVSPSLVSFKNHRSVVDFEDCGFLNDEYCVLFQILKEAASK